MKQFNALFRLLLLFFALAASILALFGMLLLPSHSRLRATAWIAVWFTRAFLAVYRINVVCQNPEKLRCHHGFIFANHQSQLDTFALFSQTPVRFLAAANVRAFRPLLWLAGAIGTAFVNRADQTSRTQARATLVEQLHQEPTLPFVIFPEGKIRTGDELLPFRYGIFEVAVEHEIAFLPCVLRYLPTHIPSWRGAPRELLATAWQRAQYPTPLTIELIPLEPVKPKPDDDPAQLAESTRQAMAEALGME
ncbi:MAG: lysophospholipid acyltransferase family protein [Caldilineaceae bacterium]